MAGRSEAMHALKERRIAAIQRVVDRDFPNLREYDVQRQTQIMRRCEADPEVGAIEDETKALREQEAGQ